MLKKEYTHETFSIKSSIKSSWIFTWRYNLLSHKATHPPSPHPLVVIVVVYPFTFSQINAFSTKTFFQIISIMKRGSISQTLVNMVRLYNAKRIKRTWSTLSSHNWLEFSRFILHFFVLGFMIPFFYVTLIFCCVDFFNGIFLHQKL